VTLLLLLLLWRHDAAISTTPTDWLWWTPRKWLILCPVKRKTSTQSIEHNKTWLGVYRLTGRRRQSAVVFTLSLSGSALLTQMSVCLLAVWRCPQHASTAASYNAAQYERDAIREAILTRVPKSWHKSGQSQLNLPLTFSVLPRSLAPLGHVQISIYANLTAVLYHTNDDCTHTHTDTDWSVALICRSPVEVRCARTRRACRKQKRCCCATRDRRLSAYQNITESLCLRPSSRERKCAENYNK